MEIKLGKNEQPIRMIAMATQTDIIITCAGGQNHAIERFLEKTRQIPPHETINLEISKKRHQRSKEANAYMWVLIDKIADAIRDTRENIYRQAVREAGVFTDVKVQTGEPMAELIADWSDNGIGWFAETFEKIYDEEAGQMRMVRLYKGSSRYDTKQMSRLLDYVIDSAKSLGIETATPDEIARMKATWGG